MILRYIKGYSLIVLYWIFAIPILIVAFIFEVLKELFDKVLDVLEYSLSYLERKLKIKGERILYDF